MGNNHKDILNQTDRCLRKREHDKGCFCVYNRRGTYAVRLIGHTFEFSLDSNTREAPGSDSVLKDYFKSHFQTDFFFCINVHAY